MRRAVQWPLLPPLGELLADDPLWRYPSATWAGEGVARLRIWRAADGCGGHIAVVTELGLGASVTNSAESITAELHASYGRPLTLLEHWPAAEASVGGEHLDQVDTTRQRPRWRRIWPVLPANPDYDVLTAWMISSGRQVVTGGGAL